MTKLQGAAISFGALVLLASGVLYARVVQFETRAKTLVARVLDTIEHKGFGAVTDQVGAELQVRSRDEVQRVLWRLAAGALRFERDFVFSHTAPSSDDGTRADVFFIKGKNRNVPLRLKLTIWHVESQPVVGELELNSFSPADLPQTERSRWIELCAAQASSNSDKRSTEPTAPPWIAHADQRRYSTFWRQGGNAYMRDLFVHLTSLSSEGFEAYKKRYPAPETWADWYGDFSPGDARDRCARDL